MKNNSLSIISLILLYPIFLQAQVVEETISIWPNSQVVATVKDSNGTRIEYAGSYYLGRIHPLDYNDPVSEGKYRSYFKLPLHQITASGSDIQIKKVEIEYYTPATSMYTFKLTRPAIIEETNPGHDWTAIAQGTTAMSNIPYKINPTKIEVPSFVTPLQNALATNIFYWGAMGEDESSDDSFASLALMIIITYERHAYSVNFSVRNQLDKDECSLDCGQIGVGINETAIARDSPYSTNGLEGQTLNLEAYDGQTVLGNQWVFNDTEGELYKSRWVRSLGGAEALLDYSQITSRVLLNDDGAEFIANLKRNYQLSRNDLTEMGTIPAGVIATAVQENSTTITAPPSKTINGTYLAFAGWQDDIFAPRTRSITPAGNATYTALYKGIGLSDDAAAFANNSQRRLVQTRSGNNPDWLHRVYNSMGHVWYEYSGNGGSSWTLGNGGKPLDEGVGGKNPSIAFARYAPYDYNYIGVVWQQKHGSSYRIMGKMFSQPSHVSTAPNHATETRVLHTEPSDGWSVDASPNLVLSTGFGPWFVTFERKSSASGWQPGINWLAGEMEAGSGQQAGPFIFSEGRGVIVGTNASTTNTQMSLTYNHTGIMVDFIRQQGAMGSVHSHLLSVYKNAGLWTMVQYDDPPISWPVMSLRPSVVSLSDNYYAACWIEAYDMVYFYLGNPTVRHYYGYPVNSCSIARGAEGSGSSGFAVWSQQPSSAWQNRSIRFDNGIPDVSSQRTLSTAGKIVQIGNSVTSNLSRMYTTAFYPFSTPYHFATSSTLAPLSKESSLIVESRGIMLFVGDTAFRYRFGELNVDGRHIGFAEAPDTMNYGRIDAINSVLLTQPFEVHADSRIVFAEQAGFAVDETSEGGFVEGGYIGYRIELVDEASGKAIGTLREAGFTDTALRTAEATVYRLNPEGFTGRTVRARIIFETNLVETSSQSLMPEEFPRHLRDARQKMVRSNLILTKRYTETNEALKQIDSAEELRVEETPAAFTLEQNYPNPFNPVTVIRYSLPEEGHVTLNVYDMLGRLTANLVNGNAAAGYHQALFNGTGLASGIYVYRLQSNGRIFTGKMMLVK